MSTTATAEFARSETFKANLLALAQSSSMIKRDDPEYPMQFMVTDASVRPRKGWWLYKAVFTLPLLLEGNRVSINLVLLTKSKYMKVFNAVWAAVQDILSDRVVIKLDRAALVEIEETYTSLGATVVHGKGARRLQVKDLVLGFMAYHKAACRDTVGAFESVQTRQAEKYKAGMSYTDLVLLFCTSPVQKPDVGLIKKVKNSKRIKTSTADKVKSMTVSSVRLFEERAKYFQQERKRSNTIGEIKASVDFYLEKNRAFTALTNGDETTFDAEQTIVEYSRNCGVVNTRTSSLWDKKVSTTASPKRMDLRRREAYDEDGSDNEDAGSGEGTSSEDDNDEEEEEEESDAEFENRVRKISAGQPPPPQQPPQQPYYEQPPPPHYEQQPYYEQPYYEQPPAEIEEVNIQELLDLDFTA